MFSFITFEWFLKLIYKTLKYSAFLFISVDFTSPIKLLIVSKPIFNLFLFLTSLTISCCACVFITFIPAEKITHSQIMEVGVNFMTYITVGTTIALKLSSMLQGRTFFDIISNLNQCHLKVSYRFAIINPF